MREILFRGKRPYTGEWVEGDLNNCKRGSNTYTFISNTAAGSYEVIPETVGQFTGLVDRNGKRIFEGDILKTGLKDGAYRGFTWPLGVVEFRDGSFGVWRSDSDFTPLTSYAPNVYMEVVGDEYLEILKGGEG